MDTQRTATLQPQIATGASRIVVVFGAYAVKFPRVDSPEARRDGIEANLREAERWESAPRNFARACAR
jgi:hypothetical protein